MDRELKALGLVALTNAFYEEFSGLVNSYIKAAEGLDDGLFADRLAGASNVFSRNLKSSVDIHPYIWTQNDGGFLDTTGHETLWEALRFERATVVHLNGRKVFKRLNGEWYFVGEEG